MAEITQEILTSRNINYLVLYCEVPGSFSSLKEKKKKKFYAKKILTENRNPITENQKPRH